MGVLRTGYGRELALRGVSNLSRSYWATEFRILPSGDSETSNSKIRESNGTVGSWSSRVAAPPGHLGVPLCAISQTNWQGPPYPESSIMVNLVTTEDSSGRKTAGFPARFGDLL